VFFIFTTFLNIVAFNLLIAVISATYDRVDTSKDSFLCKNKAELLLELSSFYTTVDKEGKDLQYLYLFTYGSGSTDGGADRKE